MKTRKIVIAGGSGFIGMQLAAEWAKDNEVVILTRNIKDGLDNTYGEKKMINGVEMVKWDGKTIGDWAKCLEGSDLLINLAGKSVNCRYTDENKKEILDSRVNATKVLGAAINQLEHPPELWINSASTTIYRHAEDRPQDEYNGEVENDFSVQVCKAWEQAFNEQKLPGTRKVVLRIAIVLGKGGVLVPYSRMVKLGAGGRQGDGKQMFSWIQIGDLERIIDWLYQHKEQEGTFNAAAPGPVANAQFMATLRSICKMPIGIPSPTWLLQLASLVIGTETELLLKSRWVLPSRLLKERFTFKYAEIKGALESLL